jgi:hypothetical protein
MSPERPNLKIPLGPTNARNRRKLDVPGDQGEPPGGVETGLRRLPRIKTPLFDFKRDFAALLVEIVGIRAWQERPMPVRIT